MDIFGRNFNPSIQLQDMRMISDCLTSSHWKILRYQHLVYDKGEYFSDMGLSALESIYSIEYEILMETNLRVLDKLESIQYSTYYTTASNVLIDVWERYRMNKADTYLYPLIHITDLYKEYNLKRICWYQPTIDYRPSVNYRLTSASGDGNIKKNIYKFFDVNSLFLHDIGVFKVNNHFVIPLYSIPVLCQKYAIDYNMENALKQINDINHLVDSESKEIGVRYWQYYRNTHYLGLDKKRKIEYYRQLFSLPIFLNKLNTYVCSELDETQLRNSIENIFFDNEIINKYMVCDLIDYLIFVRYFFAYYILGYSSTNASILSADEFKDISQTFKKDILELMDTQLNAIINPIVDNKFHTLLEKNNNSIDKAITDIVAQLNGYVSYENHYNNPPTKQSTN